MVNRDNNIRVNHTYKIITKIIWILSLLIQILMMEELHLLQHLVTCLAKDNAQLIP